MDLVGLIPSFGNVLYTIAAFVVALSVIVAIHEYGHYIVGRWSGIKAEIFSVGFGPVLFRRTDRHGTQWQIAALPFGGYVKFFGDSNAASAPDTDLVSGLTPDERRMTIQGAPLWARAATVAAGPIFNFALSILVFASMILIQGVAKEPLTIDSLRPMPFERVELQPGDEIVEIEGTPAPPLEDLIEFIDTLPVGQLINYTVRRDGQIVDVKAPHPMPPLVVGVQPQSAAMDINLEVGDVITSVGGSEIQTFEELRTKVGESEGAPLDLKVWRDGEMLDFTLTPRRVDLPKEDGGFETRWLIGISGGILFEAQTETPGIVRALSGGVDQTFYIIRSSLSALYHIAAGAISTCNLQGPVGIAQTSGDAASQGLSSFIWFIAVLSTAVGLINLFPIPVLDGGHLVFHAFEAVTGRPPSDRAMRVLMSVGLVVLLSFMGFALTNDFFCP